jgi:hypothetical protein
MSVPVAALAVGALIMGGRAVRVVGAGALAWIVIVAAMTQAGYAGNPRYLVAAAAVGSALGGTGAALLAERLARRARVAAPLALAVLVAAFTLGSLRDLSAEVAERVDRRAALDDLLAAAGGRDALLGCARLRVAEDMRTLVAWRLDLPLDDLDLPPLKPAVVLRARTYDRTTVVPRMAAERRGFRLLARAPGWEAWAACGRAAQTSGRRNSTLTLSNPSPRIMPWSIERVFRRAVSTSAGSEAAASASLRSASW